MTKLFQAGPTGNRLLNSLPQGEFAVVKPLLREVNLSVSHTLYEARAEIGEIYFPIDCVLSAVSVMRDGHVIEVGTIGNEGVSGLPALGVTTTSPHRVFAQVGGAAWRAEARAINHEIARLPRFRDTLGRYHQAFMFQVSQCVACNGLHVIVKRCCRWLLATHDRVRGDEVALTHEFLSFMLGVRRSGVTQVLQSLRKRGLIQYANGRITILDRERLEKSACECYELVQEEYLRLLGNNKPASALTTKSRG